MMNAPKPRGRLDALRHELTSRVQTLHEELRQAAPGEIEAEEDAQLVTSSALLGQLDDMAEEELDEVELALGKLKRGTYGKCETCQGPIAGARLRAMPFARQCISCAEEFEVHHLLLQPARYMLEEVSSGKGSSGRGPG